MSPLDPNNPYGDWERRRTQGLGAGVSQADASQVFLPAARQATHTEPLCSGDDNSETPQPPYYWGGGGFLLSTTNLTVFGIDSEGTPVQTASYTVSNCQHFGVIPFASYVVIVADQTAGLFEIGTNGALTLVGNMTNWSANSILPEGGYCFTPDNAYFLMGGFNGQGGAVIGVFSVSTSNGLSYVGVLDSTLGANPSWQGVYALGMSDSSYFIAINDESFVYVLEWKPPGLSTETVQTLWLGGQGPDGQSVITGPVEYNGQLYYGGRGAGKTTCGVIATVTPSSSSVTLKNVSVIFENNLDLTLGTDATGIYLAVGSSDSNGNWTLEGLTINSDNTVSFAGSLKLGNGQFVYGFGQWLWQTLNDAENDIELTLVLNNYSTPVLGQSVVTPLANSFGKSVPFIMAPILEVTQA